MIFDPTKPVQTRDGSKVELITIKGRGNAPIIGYLGEDISLSRWGLDGTFRPELGPHKCNSDLINVPEGAKSASRS